MGSSSRNQGEFTRHFLENYKEDTDESTESSPEDDEEQEDTFSLPSFSNSVRQQLDLVNHHPQRKVLQKTRTLPSSLRHPVSVTNNLLNNFGQQQPQRDNLPRHDFAVPAPLPPPTASGILTRGLSKSQSVTSLKEVESQNSQLRSENFDLKIRLYLLEKQKGLIPSISHSHGSRSSINHHDSNGSVINVGSSGSTTTGIGSGPTSPSGSDKTVDRTRDFEEVVRDELVKKENLIRQLENQLNQKSTQLKNMRKDYDAHLKMKDMELERIKTERDQLKQQLDLVNSKKENMGQAINRQLKKIEKLLETTSLYVQEIQ
jgi:hypothetical protein